MDRGGAAVSRRGRRAALAALATAAVFALALLAWYGAPRPSAVLGALAGADVGMLVLAVAVNAIGICARAEAWRLLLRRAGGAGCSVRPVDGLSAYSVGLLGNILLPARAGELVRAGLVARRLEGDDGLALATGSVVAHRILDGVPFALLVVAVVLAGGSAVLGDGAAFAVVAVLVGFLAVGVLLARRRGVAAGEGRLRRAVAGARRGLAGLAHPPTLAAALALELLAWGGQLAVVWLALAAFGVDPALGAAALVLVAINIAVAIPALPGGVGMFQAATALSLAAGGVGAATGVAFGVGLQAVELLTTLLVAMPFAAREGAAALSLRRGMG